MKRKILFITLIITGMVAIRNLSAIEHGIGDITMQNIETLSTGENGIDINCYATGSLDCPRNKIKVRIIW